MNHYQQSFTAKANPAAVYAALTTPEGLRGWWTEECDVADEVGGTIHFRFGRTHKAMRIERLEPGREVRWRCTDAHIDVDRLIHKDEWVGTQLAFRLTPDGQGHTRLDFEHLGLVPTFECYDLCSNGWRHFMGSLHQFVETGHGKPYESGSTCDAKSETRSEQTMNTTSDTDTIERSVVINAPRERVWRALSNPEEFGTWFGANLKGQTFAPGQRARGQLTHGACGHEDVWFDVVIERIEPQDLFSYRWHPYPVDPATDYAKEQPTLVTFTLKDAPGNGTLLTVRESGFDNVPPHRRLEAFRMNSHGWEAQLGNIVRYVSA